METVVLLIGPLLSLPTLHLAAESEHAVHGAKVVPFFFSCVRGACWERMPD